MSDARGPLLGYIICFSGFHNDDEDNDVDEITERANDPNIVREMRDASLGALTNLAKSLGAVVQSEVMSRTTILIARQGLSRKRLVAEKCSIPVVSSRWLQSHGRLSLSAVRVPPLKGYVFCSTQLNAEEEATLAKIIACNGGKFDRTLNAHTSMLFIPGGWLKEWKKQQLRSRASTDAAANITTATHVELSEKIRFAWNADIPVVEYPRFVAMASLRVNGIGSGNDSMWVDGNAPCADFDTIAELCAVPSSIACGSVPPSQSNPTFPSHFSNSGGESEEKNFVTMDVKDMEPEEAWKDGKKRSREIHSIQKKSCNNSSDEREAKRCRGERTDGVIATTKIDVDASSACNNAMPFFTHSDPFLQLTLIGCKPRELLECVRMSVVCRFLRTPIPTHVTDVVVVGSELDAPQLAQLRDQLALTCGVPLQRIVSIAWLEECYNCMLQLQNRKEAFCPAPLPLSLIPPTEAYHIRIHSSATFLFDMQQPQKQAQGRNEKTEEEQEQEEKQQQGVTASPAQPNNRKSTVLDNRQPQKPLQEREPRVSVGGGPRGSCHIDDKTQRRYDADVRLAKRRVQDLLTILDPSSATDSSIMSGAPLASGLFCFIDGEFSRVELAIVRALAKHGGGMCLKLTRDEWQQAIKGPDTPSAGEPNEAARATTLARRCSVRRWRFLRDGPASVGVGTRESTQLNSGKVISPALALRVVPHGDQRPAESFLRQPPPRTQQRRDPLRYLTAVTQDYILCSLAAGQLLDPRGCFLFTRATPIEAERGARCRRRAAAGRPLRVSPWLTSRLPEKAPILGVSVFFLCTEHANGAGLQRVLTWSLASTVMELGGNVAETLRDDAVTHVVVVDVVGMLDVGAFDVCAATTLPQHSHITSHMSHMSNSGRTNSTNNSEDENEDAMCEALLAARAGPVPLSPDIQSRLPLQGLHNARAWASAGRLAIVGLDWLEACVAWGVFLDESLFALVPARTEVSPSACSVPRAFATPPPTPGRGCTKDVTLLPFDQTGRNVGPSPRVATHFDFATPTSTPSHRCALQESRTASVVRQSCPRSTLRTPRRHCVSAPRVVSPALGVPLHSPSHTVSNALVHACDVVPAGVRSPALKTPDPSSLAASRSSSRDAEERVATSGSPTHDGGGACTPIRASHVLCGGSDTGDRSATGRRSTAGRPTAPPARMPQWDPGASSAIEARHSASVSQMLRLSQPFAGREEQRGQFELVALRLHVVGDVPGREQLVRACVRISESMNSSLADGSFGDDRPDPMVLGQQQQLQQQQVLLHRATTTSMAAGFSRVEFMTPAVRDADVVVAHELTQRESVLAAIAAGLWVITPKALHDCCARQCLLPLRDLAMYEWCPELLPRSTPDRIVQLAKQCGQRRKQRQATGRRLFDGQCFLLIAANAGVARVQSLRTVIETGGGNVVAVIALNSNKSPTDKDTFNSDNNVSSRIRRERSGSLWHRSLTPLFSDVQVLGSTESVMHFIVSFIEGSERDDGVTDDVSSDHGLSTSHCGSAASSAKELLVLLDDEFDMDGTNAVPLREMIESLQKGKSQLSQAKRRSLDKQRERQKKFPHWHVASIGDGEDVGMPHLEMIRLFTSEWLTLTIQQRQKAPECVLELN